MNADLLTAAAPSGAAAPALAAPPAAAGRPVVHTLPAAAFASAQRRHFGAAVLLPTLLMVALPLQPWVPLVHSPGWAAALALGMWFLVGGVGVSVGLHRHFSHRAFDAHPALRAVLGVLGAMAAQGHVVYWVSLHRMHHAASDQPGDPHSPSQAAWAADATAAGKPLPSRWRAFWQGHMGWVLRHDVPKPQRYARELLADPLARRLVQHYLACVWAGVLLPAAVGAWALQPSLGWLGGALFGAYWGGVVRIALGHHVIWAINSWCHTGGKRPHATAERSGNVAALALLSWGESWHNNHHAKPAAARFGQGWRQPDIGWWVVLAFVALGWARLRTEDAPLAQVGAANAYGP
jgi:stearoyl-CoA desaturase (delta-9 desaturase)